MSTEIDKLGPTNPPDYDEKKIGTLWKDLNAHKHEKPDSWRKYLDPENFEAALSLGIDIGQALDSFSGTLEQWQKINGRKLHFNDKYIAWAHIGTDAMRRSVTIIDPMLEAIDGGQDSLLEQSLHAAIGGNMHTVDALLEGRPPSDAIRTVRSIALIESVVYDSFSSDSGLTGFQIEDRLSAAGVHLARLVMKDMTGVIPGLVDKALAKS